MAVTLTQAAFQVHGMLQACGKTGRQHPLALRP